MSKVFHKRISILGSTGSIGTQALEVIEALGDAVEVLALCGGENIELLVSQIKKFNPKKVCTKNANDASILRSQFPKIEILWGPEGLEEICSDKNNDMVLVATSGKIGLKPTLRAIENGIDIALANKETLVMAGEIVMKAAKENGVKILPVDSEHSAIFQCVSRCECDGRSQRAERSITMATCDDVAQEQKCVDGFSNVNKIIITASGGPFLNKTPQEIAVSTLEDALSHPKWNMGQKITIDSATLMNKGLEVIEARHLFNLPYEKIDVVIHPQSIIHSAVEFLDGSILAQIGVPSMHIPIQFALTYPERMTGIKSNSFNFFEHSLTFEKPDFEKFPCLKLAYEAGKIGGTMPTVLNAANEAAVGEFLRGKISINKIAQIVEAQMACHNVISNPTLDEIFEIDVFVREAVLTS